MSLLQDILFNFYEHIFPYNSSSPTNSIDDLHDTSKTDSEFLFDAPTAHPPAIICDTPQLSSQPFINDITQSATTYAEEQTRKSTIPRRPPTYLQDFHCNNISQPSNSNSLYPLSSVLSYSNLSSSHLHFTLSFSAHRVPTTYK